METKYKNQYNDIKWLLDRIEKKAFNFAKQETNPFYEDLGNVIENLAEIDEFLNDKYLITDKRK